MWSVTPREPGDARAGCPAVRRRGHGRAPRARDVAPHPRRAYAMARRQLDAWLEGRPLDDASLAAYLGHLHEAGRAPATAAMVVATVKRSARDASTAVPIGPLTRRALEGFRRTDAADAPPRRSQARGLTADRVRHRPRHLPPPAPHRPRPRAPEDRRAPWPGRRCDRCPAVPRRPPTQRGGLLCAGPTLTSVTAATARPRSVTCTPRPHRNRVIRWPASASTGSTVRAGRASASEPHAAKWRRQPPAPAVLVTSSNTTSTTAEPVDSAQE